VAGKEGHNQKEATPTSKQEKPDCQMSNNFMNQIQFFCNFEIVLIKGIKSLW